MEHEGVVDVDAIGITAEEAEEGLGKEAWGEGGGGTGDGGDKERGKEEFEEGEGEEEGDTPEPKVVPKDKWFTPPAAPDGKSA